VAVLVAGGFLLTTACFVSMESTASGGKKIIIFLDYSESIRAENRALIAQDFESSIIPSLSAGDRILVAPINEKTLTNFHPVLDETLPSMPEFSGWSDNTLQYNRNVKAIDSEIDRIREEIRSQVPDILAGGGSSQKTDIFSSLLMAQKLFNQESKRKVLILMSDMIVDYPPYRFDKISWSAEKKQEILSELQVKGLIPDLSGVCVYISGVSAGSAELAGQISDFWQMYFERTNADLDPSRYAHVLLHWPPSEDCAS
jgi:hypothetical protein